MQKKFWKNIVVFAITGITLLNMGGCMNNSQDKEKTEMTGNTLVTSQMTPATEMPNVTKKEETKETKENKEEVFKGTLMPPAYVSENVNGEKISLDKFAGKVVVLTIGATWCPDCQAELKELNQVYANYKDNEKVVFLPTYLVDGEKETKETIAEFVNREKIEMPIYYGDKTEIRKNFKISWIPTFLVIGKDGKCLEMNKAVDGKIEYYRNMDITQEFIKTKIDEALSK